MRGFIIIPLTILAVVTWLALGLVVYPQVKENTALSQTATARSLRNEATIKELEYRLTHAVNSNTIGRLGEVDGFINRVPVQEEGCDECHE
jgi:hypothetical protein